MSEGQTITYLEINGESLSYAQLLGLIEGLKRIPGFKFKIKSSFEIQEGLTFNTSNTIEDLIERRFKEAEKYFTEQTEETMRRFTHDKFEEIIDEAERTVERTVDNAMERALNRFIQREDKRRNSKKEKQ